MKKKKTKSKRAPGKKLFNFAFEIADVNRWKEKAAQDNRSLTNLIELTMNNLT